ncbi:MAG: hypothetical protein LKG90_05415 [Lachnospiraceae bacterium]|nr:hypothetical protein [Lachnospiraceae bacterium]MCH4027817.1 hypothetical protein [Lachnospiraceae bacterium]MCH4065659.1 hypothetical protein [Lachnospiraceae bacterium]MCH4111697.1 hypothetical protein [Lachnospiraceae bacterium]MCI1353353.1 hypothetical protein [Lachnospiraceae bacterium]
MTTTTTAAYEYRTGSELPLYALKRRKAQKQCGFRAKSTYGHCIKDKVLIDPQVANGKSFAKIYDNIVCGYGFTDEPDYIYILDAGDGHTVNRMSVKTAPSYFTLLGSYLYVACYDTGYVFRYQ